MDFFTSFVGRLFDWIMSQVVSVGFKSEVRASLCTGDHSLIFVVGPGVPPSPPAPVHMDILLRVWSAAHRTTVHTIEVEAAGQALVPDNFFGMTLEPGGAPEEQNVEVHPPHGEELRAAPGDRVELRLMLTRGRPRKLKLRLEPED